MRLSALLVQVLLVFLLVLGTSQASLARSASRFDVQKLLSLIDDRARELDKHVAAHHAADPNADKSDSPKQKRLKYLKKEIQKMLDTKGYVMKGNKEDWEKLGIDINEVFNEVVSERKRHVQPKTTKVTDSAGCKEEDWCEGNLAKNADGTPSYKCVNFKKECPCTCAGA